MSNEPASRALGFWPYLLFVGSGAAALIQGAVFLLLPSIGASSTIGLPVLVNTGAGLLVLLLLRERPLLLAGALWEP